MTNKKIWYRIKFSILMLRYIDSSISYHKYSKAPFEWRDLIWRRILNELIYKFIDFKLIVWIHSEFMKGFIKSIDLRIIIWQN